MEAWGGNDSWGWWCDGVFPETEILVWWYVGDLSCCLHSELSMLILELSHFPSCSSLVLVVCEYQYTHTGGHCMWMLFRIIPQALCTRYGLAIGYYCSPLVIMLMVAFLPIAFPIALLLDCILGAGHGTFFRRAGEWVGVLGVGHGSLLRRQSPRKVVCNYISCACFGHSCVARTLAGNIV